MQKYKIWGIEDSEIISMRMRDRKPRIYISRDSRSCGSVGSLELKDIISKNNISYGVNVW